MAAGRRFLDGWVGGIALLSLLGLTSGASADEKLEERLNEKIDEVVRAEMQEEHIPGLSRAVVRGGQVVKAQGYGLASVELNAPATADTVYHLASVSKPITAMAVLLLVQDGKLGLDDKISRYLEKTPAAWKDVTIRQLLTHTSGIKDHLNEMHGRTCNGTSPEEIISQIGTLPLNFPPGSQWLYSNTGYIVLQMIIRKASGQTFDEILAGRVFGPLGMQATRRNSPDDVIPNRAAGYLWEEGRLRNSPFLDPTLYDNADSGLISSVRDLVRWDAALDGTRLLQASTRELMWSPVALSNGSRFPYGLGWHLEMNEGHRLIYHEGNRQDGATVMARYLDDKLSVIVLTNRGNARATRIARRVAGLIVPALATVLQPIVDTDPQVTDRVKTVLLKIQAGTVDAAPFTPKMWQGFYPTIAQSFRDALRSFGTFRSIALLTREMKGEARSFRYRATFGETILVIDVTLTKDGKISEMQGGQE